MSLAGCEDEAAPGVTDVMLNFRGQFGSEPLVMYQKEYAYEEGMRLRFQLFQFYISDVQLMRSPSQAGENPELIDVALVSFEDVQSENAADAGIRFVLEDIPAGAYEGIRFGVGLTPALNSTGPGDYRPGHPLSDHYWSWARGYVFSKIEGNADTDGDGDFESKLTFHIGENEMFREKVFEQPLTLEGGSVRELDFNVDLRSVLVGAGNEFIDFREVTQDHTNDLELARRISDNLARAIVVTDL